MVSTKAASAVKKPAKATKAAKSESTHPTYAQMIKEAITELNGRKGSSRPAILKYITEHYDINHHNTGGEHTTNQHLNRALKHGLETGEFKHATSHANGASGSFKLGDKSRESKKKASGTPKAASKKSENGNTGAASKKTENDHTGAAGSTPKKAKKTANANKSSAVKKPTGNKSPAVKKPAANKSPAAKKSTKKTKATMGARGKKSADKKGKAAAKK